MKILTMFLAFNHRKSPFSYSLFGVTKTHDKNNKYAAVLYSIKSCLQTSTTILTFYIQQWLIELQFKWQVVKR